MIDSVKRPIAGCLACVGGLVLVTLLAYRQGTLERLDAKVFSDLSAHMESPLGDVAALVVHIADPLSQVVMLVLVCLVALRWGRTRHAIVAVALVAGANLTTQILKAVLAHPRYQPNFGYQVGSTSFPSGHATTAMSMALAFLLVVPRSWRPVVIAVGACLVVAVCCSVVILRRHYPSDVIGGLLVAMGWYWAVIASLRIAERLRPHRHAQLAG